MSTKRRVKKRPRLNANEESANKGKVNPTNGPTQRATLTNLPIELLAEILLITCSPPTVLAVARTCSYLNRTLALNPAASFIWRGVRETCVPSPLPDPGKAWKGTEAQYAAFVFDGGRCEVCHKNTRAMYLSFSARIRLCRSSYCLRKFIDESLVNVTTQLLGRNLESLWVPYVESSHCLRFHPPAAQIPWPRNPIILLRKTDWEKFKRDLVVYAAVERANIATKRTAAPVPGPAVVKVGNDPIPQGDEEGSVDSVIRHCHAAVERFPEIMSLSVKLLTWRIDYDVAHRGVRRVNEIWSKNIAGTEGWDSKDLLMSDAFSSLLRRKSFLLEKLSMTDMAAIRPDIESQLLARQARRNRHDAEWAYKQKLTDVQKMYDSMRCGTLQATNVGSSGPTPTGNRMILPPLHVFCALPSVRTLKGRPDPSVLPPNGNATASNNLKSSPLAKSLVVSDIQTWLIPVKSYLMGLLGYPNGWQSASRLKVHPLERVTARFLCGRCRDGGVGRRLEREGCLDLRGVCSHACTSTKRKITEDRRQETQGEGEAPVGEGSNKNNKERTYDWKVEVFQKDEKAIRLINNVLGLLRLSDEDPVTAVALDNLCAKIRCKSCTGWITMDVDAAIGHAHRHENMEIEIVLTSRPPPETTKVTGPSVDSCRAFERGIVERILSPAYSAKKLQSKVDYGCKHCPSARAKAMDFNALRSHAKAKHGIQDIRDEDVFTYSSGILSGGTTRDA